MVFETGQDSQEAFDTESATAVAANVAKNNTEMLTDDASPTVTDAMESGGKVPSIEELAKDLGNEPDILALLASAPDGKILDTCLTSMQSGAKVIVNNKPLRAKERISKPPVSEVKGKITDFLKDSIVRVSATGNTIPITYSNFTSFDAAFRSAKPGESIFTSKDGNNKNKLEYDSFPNLMKSLVIGIVNADLKKVNEKFLTNTPLQLDAVLGSDAFDGFSPDDISEYIGSLKDLLNDSNRRNDSEYKAKIADTFGSEKGKLKRIKSDYNNLDPNGLQLANSNSTLYTVSSMRSSTSTQAGALPGETIK